MAYSFDMLGPQFTAAHFRSKIEGFFDGAPDGWPCWAFSNHDVIRHATRWRDHGDPEAVAKLAAAMLLSFEGSICLYQGEELGQTETDIEYHELTDPPGFRFWPEYKGHGGFSTVKPWLPVKAPQHARNVAAQDGVPGSVLEQYRALLAFRRAQAPLLSGRSRFFDLPEPVLAFLRDTGTEALACVFNLSATPVALTVAGVAQPIGPAQAATLRGQTLTLGPNGFAFLPATGAGSAIAITATPTE
jgi:alpha-glucosidase